MIQNQEGAYSQLVHLQEGAKESEHSQQVDAEASEIEKSMSRSGSQKMRRSLSRSLSRASSGSRHSFTINTLGLGLLTDVNIHETEEQEENIAEEKQQQTIQVPMKRLAYLNKPELPILLVGTIAAAVHGTIFPVFGIVLSTAIKVFYEPPVKLKRDSKFWAVIYICIGFVALISLSVQNYFFGIAGAKLIQRIRSMTFERVVHQEISWFDDPANSRFVCIKRNNHNHILQILRRLILYPLPFSSGAVGARLSTDASTVRSIVGDALALVVQNVTTILAALIIAFTANWILALIILAISPLLLIQGFIQAKFMKGFSADANVSVAWRTL